jgi:hypothetical protein
MGVAGVLRARWTLPEHTREKNFFFFFFNVFFFFFNVFLFNIIFSSA